MNRGSLGSPRPHPPTACRFNEAPIHESGKSGRGSRFDRRDCGFNEAPIHESGKWSQIRPSAKSLTCFNEAPIHESGKYIHMRAGKTMAWAASMRPRFMNRGSAEDA